MAFLWSSKKSKEETVPEAEIRERTQRLQRDIQHLEDTIYGVALFFEGLSLLHAGQTAVIETYQKQFRNVIETDRDTLKQARELLQAVEQDPTQAARLRQFSIVPCKGHSNPAEMERRAQVLVDTYNRVFPERPRSREFAEEEAFRLTEEAVRAFAALK